MEKGYENVTGFVFALQGSEDLFYEETNLYIEATESDDLNRVPGRATEPRLQHITGGIPVE